MPDIKGSLQKRDFQERQRCRVMRRRMLGFKFDLLWYVEQPSISNRWVQRQAIRASLHSPRL